MSRLALVSEVLTDVHARTIRAYEALEDGDAGLASDLLHDLTRELAEWRAAFGREWHERDG
jgi:hypothetical protein